MSYLIFSLKEVEGGPGKGRKGGKRKTFLSPREGDGGDERSTLLLLEGKGKNNLFSSLSPREGGKKHFLCSHSIPWRRRKKKELRKRKEGGGDGQRRKQIQL